MLEEKLAETQAKLKKRIQELILPLLVFVIGAFAVLFFGIWQSVSEMDRSEVAASETLFGAILSDQKEQLRGLVVDSSYWDAAVTNLVLNLDRRWAENNVGTYLHKAHSLSGTYVIGDDDQTTYSVEDSEELDIDVRVRFPKIEEFFESVRLSHEDESVDAGLTEFRVGQDGSLYIISAAVINPDFAVLDRIHQEALKKTRYILLLTNVVDQTYLDSISKRYSFPKIKLQMVPVDVPVGTSSWRFTSINNTAVGWSTWQMPLHGDQVLASILKNISISIVALLILTSYIGYRGMALNKLVGQGILDFAEAKKIAKNFERAISNLGQGESLYELSVGEAFNKIAVNATNTMEIDLVSLWQISGDKLSLNNLYCFDTAFGNLKTEKEMLLSAYPRMIDEKGNALSISTSNIWDEPLLVEFAQICFDVTDPLSFLAVPVIRHRKVIGLVCFANRNTKFDWSEERCRFASAIADFVSIIFEVQAQKIVETELRAAKDTAEAANIAKSDFLANMSHELRTPLNAIIGFSDLIGQEIYGKLGSAQYVEYVADINMSGRHLLSLINEILDVSKTQSGTYVIYPEDVNIAGELENVTRLLRGRFARKEFEIHIDINEGAEVIYADPKSFRQILINILSNAIKFCETKSDVFVRVTSTQENVLISVKDNGIGIPPENLAEIFKPFVQVENIMSKKFEGTGLGLSITRALVELHQGKVSIESSVDDGTNVTIQLPVRP
ncbi:MAG: GAF domain-containing protein [Sneathiella sp.]|nr:GAF domain-containing protein [Sneathiella sp.]